MNLKIILLVAITLFYLKIHSQTPSINETRSEVFLNNKKFKEEFTKIYKEEIALLDRKKESDLKVAGLLETGKANIESRFIQDKAILEAKIGKLNIDRSYYGYDAYYKALIKKKMESINDLYGKVESWDFQDEKKDNMENLKSTYDTINQKRIELQQLIAERDEKLAYVGSFDWFLPTVTKGNRKQFFHDMYNNKTEKSIFLNSFALNGNSDATSVQNEIVTDNMWALRVTFGSVLSLESKKADPAEIPAKTKKETEEEALNRLLNGGGNFYLEFLLPLAATNQNNGDQITAYSYANIRGAMDIKSISNNIDTSTGNGTLGLNQYFGISSDSRKFNFFALGNINYTFGTNEFYSNLGLTDAKGFLNGRLLAGITILNNFRISLAVCPFGSDEKVRSNKVTVGIQIMPGL